MGAKCQRAKYNDLEDVEIRINKIQVRLDKIMHVLETKTKEVPVQFDVDTENLRDTDLKFPIESINDLETLENNLQDKNFELKLVTKFSKISGTNGMQTLRKFGIFLMSHIIKDECLHLCSWKDPTNDNFLTNVKEMNAMHATVGISVSFGITQKGGPMLKIGRHQFTVHRTEGSKTRWQCSKQKPLRCKARILTIEGHIVMQMGVHNHK
ncbi:hypothetical protein MSG28_008226 [Choristoneura fumiferana]|uniref:Uncharacterized protein n=1 Tax=Choristoneura fumiferana TaxID=7141 RepID=A0ACC0JAJ8_CHOFU|nr:hypothetical protein MSG28_008226 [Choristoneura fumiferana]